MASSDASTESVTSPWCKCRRMSPNIVIISTSCNWRQKWVSTFQIRQLSSSLPHSPFLWLCIVSFASFFSNKTIFIYLYIRTPMGSIELKVHNGWCKVHPIVSHLQTANKTNPKDKHSACPCAQHRTPPPKEHFRDCHVLGPLLLLLLPSTSLSPMTFIHTGNQHIYFCPIYEEKTPSLKHCTCDEMHPTRKTFAVNFRICYNEVTGNHTYWAVLEYVIQKHISNCQVFNQIPILHNHLQTMSRCYMSDTNFFEERKTKR